MRKYSIKDGYFRDTTRLDIECATNSQRSIDYLMLCWFFHELEGAVWKTADEIAGVNSNTGSH